MSIGFACKTIGVPGTEMSSCILKNATLDNLRKITEANLIALENIIDYNIKNGIALFRISSDVVPFGSHPVNTIEWWNEFGEILTRIGEKIRTSGMRVSMHPGQYTVLNSPNSDVVTNATSDLIYHARFLDCLGIDSKNKIVIHIGGVYGDKALSKRRFVDNFYKLGDNVKSRLIIENDDKNYNIFDVLEISGTISCPVVYDNLHNLLNPSSQILTDVDCIKECSKTWSENDGQQKIHYSQQKQGAIPGAHSETIFIEEFLNFYKSLNDSKISENIDIMLEVKDKNLSAIKCSNVILSNLPSNKIEKEWARYKYFVLSRSARIYNEIRKLIKEKNSYVAIEFYKKIEKALSLPEDIGAEVNSAQHIWGYVNKNASSMEKKKFENLLQNYTKGNGGLKLLKNHLKRCSEKQKVEYLIDSLYFYI